MNNLGEVLRKLEQADMHVHEKARAHPLPVHTLPTDTHFIMNGADIVHVGNVTTIERFALRLP